MFQGSCNDMMEYENSNKFDDTKQSHGNEKIRNLPVVRQDSITLDIGLGNCVTETPPKMISQKESNSKEENICELPVIQEHKSNSQQQHSRGKQERLTNPSQSSHLGIHRKHRKQEASCIQQPTQPLPSGLIYEERPLIFPTHATRGICPDNPELFNGRHVSMKEASKVFTCDDSTNYEADMKKKDINLCKDINDVTKFKWKNWDLMATFRKDNITSALLVAVIVLAIGFVHLHLRMQAVESREFLSSKGGCQCHQNGQMLNKGQVADTKRVKSANGEMHRKINQYFNRENDESLADDDTSNPMVGVSENEDNLQFQNDAFLSNYQTETGPEHLNASIDNLLGKLKTKKDNMILGSINSMLSTNDSQKIGSGVLANKNNKLIARKDENIVYNYTRGSYSFPTSDVRIIDLSDLSQDASGEKHSRHIRSSPIKTKDKDFANKRRKEFEEISKEGKQTRSKDSAKTKAATHKVETFESQFYGNDSFDYTTHFMKTDCFVHADWKHNPTVCRDGSVNITTRYFALPFYHATKETTKIKHKQRMLTTEKASGKFHVHIPGDYLVQLNITIEDSTSSHFLALHVNGQALLACQQGGFHCPNMNPSDLFKYRVCNIVGLLDLKIDDVIDIRTMEPNMKLHIAEDRKSYFKVILLNQRK